MSEFDTREFRNALGAFATGVTVVTTRAPEGHAVGLTATSFNSVSMEPPLVLWSLQRISEQFEAFRESDGFAVHVLTEGQVALSQRFAAKDIDRFADLGVIEGLNGLPLLPDCAAVFQCRKFAEYDGGDHIIFVGEVLAFQYADSTGLAFYRGGYAGLSRIC